jgi:hypothetical protein
MKKRIEFKRDRKRAMLVQELAKQFECSDVNVRKALRGDSKTDQSLEILKEYKKKYQALTTLLS